MKNFSSIDRSRYYILEQISRKYYYDNKNNNETAHSRIELKDLDYTEKIDKSLHLSQKSLQFENSGRNLSQKAGTSRSQYSSQQLNRTQDSLNENFKMDLDYSSYNQQLQYQNDQTQDTQNQKVIQENQSQFQISNVAQSEASQHNDNQPKKSISASSSSSKQNRLGMQLMSTQNIIVNEKNSSTTSEKNSFQSITPEDHQVTAYTIGQLNVEVPQNNNNQQVKKSVHFNNNVNSSDDKQKLNENITLKPQNSDFSQQYDGFQSILEKVAPQKHDIETQTDEISTNNSTPSSTVSHRYDELLEQLNNYKNLLNNMRGWQLFKDSQVFKLQEEIDNIKYEMQEIQPTSDDFDDKIIAMGSNLKNFFGQVRKATDQISNEKKIMQEEMSNLQHIIKGLKTQVEELQILQNDDEVKDVKIIDLNSEIAKIRQQNEYLMNQQRLSNDQFNKQIVQQTQNYKKLLSQNSSLQNQILALESQLQKKQQLIQEYEQKNVTVAVTQVEQKVSTNSVYERQSQEELIDQNAYIKQLKQSQDAIIKQFQQQIQKFKEQLTNELKKQHVITELKVDYQNLLNDFDDIMLQYDNEISKLQHRLIYLEQSQK